MLELFLIYGIILYFLGLVVSGLLSFVFKKYEKAIWLFVFFNAVGFISTIAYFLFFAGQKIVLISFDSLMQSSFQLTPLSAIFFLIISGVSAMVGVYSVRYLALYEHSYNPRLVLFLMSFFVVGMQGVLLSSTAFSFLLFWELMSISSFFLVLSDKSRESIKAAFLYFIMTHLGASAILGGFLILGNGSIFVDLNTIKMASANLSPAFLNLAFALFIFGFGSKAGLVPFHVWLPEAHPQAPSNISAMMSGLMLKIAVYGFILVTLGFASIPSWAGLLVLSLGLISGLVGVLNAVTKRDIKTVLAYSSIENMGIIFTMLGLAIYLLNDKSFSLLAYSLIAFAIMHAISHALFKTALFLSSGVIVNRTHTRSLEKMGGIARIMPFFSAAFLLGILASLAIPPFGTFYGEWGLVQNMLMVLRQAVFSPETVVVFLISLATIGLISGLAIFAMIRVFALSMLGLAHRQGMEKESAKSDFLLTAPIFILGLGVVALGVFASPLLSHLINQAENLFQPVSYSSSVSININSGLISLALLLLAIIIFFLNKIFFSSSKERLFKTWDCGQAIDVTMQYSATAFVAPIRFFFLTFIGRKKTVESVAICETNPWIRKYSFSLYIKSVWSDALYHPIAKALYMLAEKLRHIQSGRIQYYVLFLLLALITTLIFAL